MSAGCRNVDDGGCYMVLTPGDLNAIIPLEASGEEWKTLGYATTFIEAS